MVEITVKFSKLRVKWRRTVSVQNIGRVTSNSILAKNQRPRG